MSSHSLALVRQRRCAMCDIAPQPRDLTYFWGETAEELASPLCLWCRQRSRTSPSAHIAYIPKLVGVEVGNLGMWLIPGDMQAALRGYFIPYLTDGARVWVSLEFPLRSSLMTLSLDQFRAARKLVWILGFSPDVPPQSCVSSSQSVTA